MLSAVKVLTAVRVYLNVTNIDQRTSYLSATLATVNCFCENIGGKRHIQSH